MIVHGGERKSVRVDVADNMGGDFRALKPI
jgi:hypothetical protein